MPKAKKRETNGSLKDWLDGFGYHQKIIVGFVIVVILFLFFMFAIGASKGVGGKPSLVVNSDYDVEFGLREGFYADFDGTVTNVGKKDAQNVVVKCFVKRRGTIIGSDRQSLGNIGQGYTSGQFRMSIDYEGSEGINGDCQATCNNC